jgi:lipopolysaccharide transport system permease protein
MQLKKNIVINLVINYHRWFYPAYISLRTRFTRTTLGPFWETASTAVFISFAGVLWAKIFNQDVKSFVPFLFTGMIIWKFYSGIINSGCSAYIENTAIIKSVKHVFLVHNLKNVTKDFLLFLCNLPLCILVNFILGVKINFNIFLFFINLPIIIIASVSLSYLLSLLCLRFRDFIYLISSLMQLIFFFTPIFFKPEQLGTKGIMYVVNPNFIYHYVELLRQPLLGNVPTFLNYFVTILFTFFLLILSKLFYKKYNLRVPYWL